MRSYADHFNDRLGADACIRYDIDPKSDGAFTSMLLMMVEALTAAAASQPDPQAWICGKRIELCRSIERLYGAPEASADLLNAIGAMDLATGQAWARLGTSGTG